MKNFYGWRFASDESLADHDRKYHKEGYTPGDTCSLREGLSSERMSPEEDGISWDKTIEVGIKRDNKKTYAEVLKFDEDRKKLGLDTSRKSMEHLFRPYQHGEANKDNFFKNTFGVFNEVSRRPKGEPDHVSRNRRGEVSSEYWYTDDGVVRGSDHWGDDVASCSWYLDRKDGSEQYQKENRRGQRIAVGGKKYGKLAWKDFMYKTGINWDGDNAWLTSFNNPIEKKDRPDRS